MDSPAYSALLAQHATNDGVQVYLPFRRRTTAVRAEGEPRLGRCLKIGPGRQAELSLSEHPSGFTAQGVILRGHHLAGFGRCA